MLEDSADLTKSSEAQAAQVAILHSQYSDFAAGVSASELGPGMRLTRWGDAVDVTHRGEQDHFIIQNDGENGMYVGYIRGLHDGTANFQVTRYWFNGAGNSKVETGIWTHWDLGEQENDRTASYRNIKNFPMIGDHVDQEPPAMSQKQADFLTNAMAQIQRERPSAPRPAQRSSAGHIARLLRFSR